MELMPGLVDEAQRRARGESDNVSVVAMTWENQDDPSVADTQSLGRRGVRERLRNTTAAARVAGAPGRGRDRRGHRARHRRDPEAIRKVPR